LIKKFVEAQDGKLKLFYLPPYSPQLNPDEQVWAHAKRNVARQATGAIQGRNEAADTRRVAPNPEIARIGEIFLSPTQVPICRYLTFLMQKLVIIELM
jgi:transposase